MSNMNSGHTTTEELIVSYLDGELVRKELEMVLFERLATSEDARLLMREYLTTRGAIHTSRSDDRFSLTASVDARTKGRIETMLKNVPALETGVLLEANFAMDKPAIATVATTRSMKRWTKRAVPTLALLLLSVITTWYVTRTTVERHEVAVNTSPATQSTSVSTPVPQAQSVSTAQITATSPRVKIVKEYIRVPQAVTPASTDMAQNGAVNNQPSPTTSIPSNETNDPKDIMISHRYSKMIRATTAIPVTQQDRL